jgi:hypothetical protein
MVERVLDENTAFTEARGAAEFLTEKIDGINARSSERFDHPQPRETFIHGLANEFLKFFFHRTIVKPLDFHRTIVKPLDK